MTGQVIAVAYRDASGADAPLGYVDYVRCSGGGKSTAGHHRIHRTQAFPHLQIFPTFLSKLRDFSTGLEYRELLSLERVRTEESH
jgi:hypothetical protein